MLKSRKSGTIPDLTEFIDESGKKWVQTSTDDLFSMNELNEIFEKIEKERDRDEVVLARIDFQKVNREYYDAAIELKRQVLKQQELLKKIATSSKDAIERKNNKLKELITYIRKLHTFIAYVSKKESPDDIEIPGDLIVQAQPMEKIPYAEVEEVPMSPDENE